MIAIYHIHDLTAENIDRFADPRFAKENFAPTASHCPKCGKSKEVRARVGELIIQWAEPIDSYSPGSDVIADFYDIGIPLTLIASDRLKNFLVDSQYRSFEFAPIHMVQDPKLKKPKRTTIRTKKRVWLPYLGPPLHELIVTGFAGVDFHVNQVEVSEHLVCSGCQRYQKLFLRPSNLAPWIIRKTDWDGSDFFRLRFPDRELSPEASFVTESLRNALISEGFTNLGFELHGHIE